MSDAVNLKDSQGNLVSVPSDRVNDALANGFTQPTHQDINTAEAQAKYGGAGGQAAAALAGAGRGATFGLSDVGLTKSGLVKPETLEGLKEANPIASGAGEVAGIGGSLLVPGLGEENAAKGALGAADLLNPVKAVSKIGTSIAEHVAPEASGIAAKALGVGLGSAAEGAAYGLGQSISDDALGDPDAMGEKLLHNVGYGALLGGGIGVGVGALGGAYSRLFGKEAAEAGQAAARDYGDVTGRTAQDAAEAREAATGVPSIGMDDAASAAKFNTPAEISQDAAKNLRPDANKTLEAAKEFGFDAQPAMLSDDKGVTFKEGTLYKSPSATGDQVRNAYETGYKNMTKGVQDILESGAPAGTPLEQTQAIRDGMISRVNEEAGPIQELYNKIEPEKAAIDVTEGHRAALEGKIQNYLDNSAPTKTQRTFINGILDDVKSLDRLDKLEGYRSEFNKEAYSLVNKDALSHVAGDLTDMFDDTSLAAIKKHLDTIPQGEFRDSARGLISDMDNARTQYAAFKDTAKAVSKALFNTEKVGGPRGFVRKLEEHLTDEKFMDRLFSKKNHEAFKTLQEIFPEQAEQIKTLEKSRIAAKARGGAGQDFNALTATKEILGDGRTRGMSKELRDQLFSQDEIRRMDLAEHGLNRMQAVRHFNPSNSGTHIAYSNFDAAQGAINALRNGKPLEAVGAFAAKPIQELKDQLTHAKLQEQVGRSGAAKVSVLSGLEKQAQKTSQKIISSAKGIFDFASKIPIGAVGAIHIPDDDEHEKQAQSISEYSNNPEKLINDLDSQTRSLYAFAPNVAGGLQKSTAAANQFLASKVPVMPSLGPLGPKLKPSQTQKTIFQNYYHGVHNPLHAMEKIKEGSLVPDDIETLTAVYPKMYQEMQKSIMSAMVDYVDKNGVNEIPNQTKMMLSLFLGQDMDASSSPQAIYANQAILGGARQQNQAQNQQQIARPSQKGLSSLNKSESLLTAQQESSQRSAES